MVTAIGKTVAAVVVTLVVLIVVMMTLIVVFSYHYSINQTNILFELV